MPDGRMTERHQKEKGGGQRRGSVKRQHEVESKTEQGEEERKEKLC